MALGGAGQADSAACNVEATAGCGTGAASGAFHNSEREM